MLSDLTSHEYLDTTSTCVHGSMLSVLSINALACVSDAGSWPLCNAHPLPGVSVCQSLGFSLLMGLLCMC